MESWRPCFHYGYDVGMLHALFTTTEGNFKVRLFDADMPNTVANFAGLAEGSKEFTDPKTGQKAKRPFYDGLVFHRVIDGFMIQGGDPLGTVRDPAENEMIELPQERNKYGRGGAFLREAIEMSHVRYSPLRDRIVELLRAPAG